MSVGGAPVQTVGSVQTASHHIYSCAFRVVRRASGIYLAVVMRSDRSWVCMVARIETKAIMLGRPAHVLNYLLDMRTARRGLDVLQADAQLEKCVRRYGHMGGSVLRAFAAFPVATAVVRR